MPPYRHVLSQVVDPVNAVNVVNENLQRHVLQCRAKGDVVHQACIKGSKLVSSRLQDFWSFAIAHWYNGGSHHFFFIIPYRRNVG